MFDGVIGGMLPGCLTVLNYLNQPKKKQMYVPFDSMIRNPFKVQ